MRLLLVSIAALAAAACATTSENAMPAQVMAAEYAAPRYIDQGTAGEIGDEEIVCRVDSPTGTRIRQPVCRTYAEWEEMQREGQRLLEHRQTGSASTY
ncbi:hypothetical protein V0U79_04305 [Hyphobacterium sp. HN65]|uniref:Uncharacterized protein n=1 Tax=Hyphobacterium lacteum TaxID=3116575 RepID=A0ABU7LNW0_9PROT|nr:hypothetical protein [Hyphobacterium sp. HN65]MEE2525577.1 hypothetical protein [Hyphobacterium sp. HN65]